MAPERAGALVQRVIELETYRTLALLGLPEAQRLAPSINRIERRLAEVTEEMRRARSLADNQRLLDELTALAAELEAGAAASLFRFGASRAYNEIVQTAPAHHRRTQGRRVSDLVVVSRAAHVAGDAHLHHHRGAAGQPVATSWRAPPICCARASMSNCEQQNRDLLKSMNERTRLQLRLQATVEGLSVAAISYYVVGLFGYVVKGVHDAGWPVDPTHRHGGVRAGRRAADLVDRAAHPHAAYRQRARTRGVSLFPRASGTARLDPADST